MLSHFSAMMTTGHPIWEENIIQISIHKINYFKVIFNSKERLQFPQIAKKWFKASKDKN